MEEKKREIAAIMNELTLSPLELSYSIHLISHEDSSLFHKFCERVARKRPAAFSLLP